MTADHKIGAQKAGHRRKIQRFIKIVTLKGAKSWSNNFQIVYVVCQISLLLNIKLLSTKNHFIKSNRFRKH